MSDSSISFLMEQTMLSDLCDQSTDESSGSPVQHCCILRLQSTIQNSDSWKNNILRMQMTLQGICPVIFFSEHDFPVLVVILFSSSVKSGVKDAPIRVGNWCACFITVDSTILNSRALSGQLPLSSIRLI